MLFFLLISLNKSRKESTDMKMTETNPQTTEHKTATCMPLFIVGIAGNHGLATDVFRYGKVN